MYVKRYGIELLSFLFIYLFEPPCTIIGSEAPNLFLFTCIFVTRSGRASDS